MTATGLPLRPELAGAVPYGAPQLDVAVRLDTNENPYPPPPCVIDDIMAAVGASAVTLNRYPDREAAALRGDLAAYLGHGLDATQVWAANGSNEVMAQLLQAFGGPGRTVAWFTPTYSMYPVFARSTATRWVSAERDTGFGVDVDAALALLDTERPDVVLLTSPNNPTGTALPLSTVETVARHTDGIVVVDEAYAEFRRPGVPSALELLPRYPRLVVTRTMSKAFALAGARLGYLAAAPAVVAALRLVRLPYHLSSLTQAVARVALAHSAALLGQIDTLRHERDSLVATLRGSGFTVADSDANFVMFGRFPDASVVWQGLLDRGVLVREPGLAGWLRVTIGTPEQMVLFRDALREVVAR